MKKGSPLRRSYLVAAGTLAGVAGVLLFPTRGLPTGGTAPSSAGTGSGATGSTSAGSGSRAATSAGGTSTGGSGATAAGRSSSTSTAPAARSATGADESYPYGNLAVKVTVDGHKITHVAVTTQNETDGQSVSIDDYAIPRLERQVISADSANIQGVSGATFTSEAFAQSVASALKQLGFTA